MERAELDGWSGAVIEWDDPLAEVVMRPVAGGVLLELAPALILPNSRRLHDRLPDQQIDWVVLHGARADLLRRYRVR